MLQISEEAIFNTWFVWVRFGWEKSPSTFAPAFERGSDVKDEMIEDRIERIAEGNAWNKEDVFISWLLRKRWKDWTFWLRCLAMQQQLIEDFIIGSWNDYALFFLKSLSKIFFENLENWKEWFYLCRPKPIRGVSKNKYWRWKVGISFHKK